MMAGILFRFGADAMGSLGSEPVMFAILLTAFLVLNVWMPRYTVILLLGIGVALAWGVYDVPVETVSATLATPVLTMPVFSAEAVLSLGVPLVLITLSGQFLPGIAIIRANGYNISARPTLVVASLTSIPAAFFGGITTALAAITAALCASPAAHADPRRRYTAGVAAGVFRCIGGVFAGSIVELLVLLPASMIALLAGLALLGAILKGLSDTLAGPDDVQAGLLAFIITTADFSLWGVSSAFWGVIVGVAAVHLTRMANYVAKR
jgi:benzoate membrane transport protein